MSYTHLNLADVKDMAPDFGIDSLESRFPRAQLGAETIGLAAYKVKPGRRVGFGHSHTAVEEVYVITSGTGRFKLDDDIVDVTQGDVLFCPPQTMREWEAGPDGMELLAFGGHAEGDGSMEQGWWTD